MKITKNYVTWGMVVVLLCLLNFFGSDYVSILMCLSLLYAILGLGLNFTMGMAGVINLGLAGFFGIGAYVSALTSLKLGLSPWVGCFIGTTITGLIGYLLGYISIRMRGIFIALTTIAFGEVIEILFKNLEVAGGTMGLKNIPPFAILNFKIDTYKSNFYLILFFFLVVLYISYRIYNSKWRLLYFAQSDYEIAVSTCGFSVNAIRIQAFVLSAVFAGFAGTIYAHFQGYIHPSMFNLNLTFSFLLMVLIGGIGTIEGPVIGAFFMTLLPELLRPLKDYYMLICGVILLVICIFMPRGLVSLFKMKYTLLDRRNYKNGNKE